MKPRVQKRRRLIIQLAALVDLLFVVMFLQYTEQTRTAAKQSGRLQMAAANADELKQMVLADQENLRKKRDELAGEVESLKQKFAKEASKNIDIEKQLREIGEVAAELIPGVDPEALKARFRKAPKEEIALILEALRDAKGLNATQLVQMFRKSSEVKNWCDIWEVHLFEDSRTDAHVRVRGPSIREQEFRTNDKNEFTNRFMRIVNQAGEPKSLVIILFTRGDAYLRPIEDVREALEQVKSVWSGKQPGKRIETSSPKYSAEAP